MDTLTAWIKQIVLLLLFATFLELLIPSNGYKKFVKVIMGLLILLAILQPVLDLMQQKLDDTLATEVTARNIADNRAQVPSQATDLQSERERIALEQYRKELIKQIRVIGAAVEGVAEVKAEVALIESKGEKNYGMIRSVTLYAKAGNPGNKEGTIIKPVKPVEVDQTAPGSQVSMALDERKREQIKRVVAEFYHLKTEQVIVKEWG